MASQVEARCPLRPQDKCSLCFPGADGPQNCGLVYRMMTDEDLREDYAERRQAERRARH